MRVETTPITTRIPLPKNDKKSMFFDIGGTNGGTNGGTF
nr:MAG TPA: putative yrbi family phosphatase [Caudoviricetes sp.]